ncbi:MAG: FAD-dependent oxidoreductase [Nanoarchaeota archaeon]|nr:FAD-dependent oxidoreductase [Nanoarchaeota archaeon]
MDLKNGLKGIKTKFRGLNSIRMKILDRLEIAEDTYEIRLKKPLNFTYKAGQYVSIIINDKVNDGRGKMRSFSLSSSPSNSKFISTCFRLPKKHSDFKNYLMKYPMGTEVSISGPRGKFILPESTEKLVVMIAGGVGITPFIGMIKFATETKSKQKIKLLYTDKSEKRIAYFDELVKLDRLNKNFSFNSRYKRVDPKFIIKNCDPSKVLFYVCGTPKMVTGVREMLLEMGVSKKVISFENFTGY